MLTGDFEKVANLSLRKLDVIPAATLTGMDLDAFQTDVKSWLDSAKHPRWNRLYTELTYQPMQKVVEGLPHRPAQTRPQRRRVRRRRRTCQPTMTAIAELDAQNPVNRRGAGVSKGARPALLRFGGLTKPFSLVPRIQGLTHQVSDHFGTRRFRVGSSRNNRV